MLRSAVAALLLLAIVSCSGGDGPTGGTPLPPTTPTLTPLTDTARVGAMLVVDLANANLTTDTVSARVGSTSVRLVRVTGSTFAAQVPDLPAGQSTLEFSVAGAPVRTTITVLPGLAIADPLATIHASLDATLAAVPVTAPSGVTTAEWAARRATLDSLVREARAQVASLSAEQRLAIARLLVSSQITASSPASGAVMLQAATPPLLGLGWFKLSPCQRAMKKVVDYGLPTLAMLGGMVVFIVAPLDPVSKAVGTIATGAAFAGSLLLAVDAWQGANVTCGVITQADLQDDPFASAQLQRGTDVAARVTTTATTRRFFANRPVMQYPTGTFRRLGSVDIGKDLLIRQMHDVLEKLNTQVSSVASRLPAQVQRILPSMPPRLGAPSGGAAEAIPPSDVRIANVSPASVQLTAAVSGTGLALQTAAQVTDDVPFTYDVISVYDSTVRVTKAGVARPLMSASAVNVPATVTGTRTITTDANGVQYGTLTCGGSATVRVKGGDTAEWRDFAWQITGPSTINGSDPIRAADGSVIVFESGDRPFTGSWFYSWRENGQPVYRAFTVTISITYFDRVLQAVKTVTPFSFQCI